MREKLVQRRHRFGLGREYRAALRGKLVRDAALGGRDHQRLAGLLAESGCVARKGFDVVTGAGDRHADQERVRRRIFRDHRQDVAEQPAVGQQRRGEIDRIGGSRKARQDALQLLVGLFSQLRHRHADGGGGIRRHHADRAGIADGDKAPAFRLPAFQIKLGGLDQAAHIGRAPDAVMLEERIDHAILVGERAGVRLRRLPAGFGAAGLQCDDRQVAVERDRGEFLQIFLLGNALQIQQQQFYLRVFRDRHRKFADGDVGVVAGGVGMAGADAALAQKADRHGRERAALAQHRDMALGAVHVHEHGGEAGDGAGAEIGQPLRVRPDDAHAGLVRGFHHAPLFRLAGDRVDFAKTRRHHHRDLDAMRRAIFHRANGVVAGHRDDHHLRRFGQIGEARIALVALHFRARRIDRENPALEAELVEVMHRPAADLVGIFRRADHGDGFGIEGGSQTTHDLVLAK